MVLLSLPPPLGCNVCCLKQVVIIFEHVEVLRTDWSIPFRLIDERTETSKVWRTIYFHHMLANSLADVVAEEAVTCVLPELNLECQDEACERDQAGEIFLPTASAAAFHRSQGASPHCWARAEKCWRRTTLV